MDDSKLRARLHDFERKVYLGVTGLAGVGAVAVVSKWQESWASMTEVRDQFAELTGGEDVTYSVYDNINNALVNLGNVVATGGQAAIHEAGSKFYWTLVENHERLDQLLPAEVRGAGKSDEPPAVRAVAMLGKALGLN